MTLYLKEHQTEYIKVRIDLVLSLRSKRKYSTMLNVRPEFEVFIVFIFKTLKKVFKHNFIALYSRMHLIQINLNYCLFEFEETFI